MIPSLSAPQAVAPLMAYLEQELQYMNENLVQENFYRYEDQISSKYRLKLEKRLHACPVSCCSLLTPLWNNSVKIIHQLATQHQQQQQEGLMVYCQRLLYTLRVGASRLWL